MTSPAGRGGKRTDAPPVAATAMPVATGLSGCRRRASVGRAGTTPEAVIGGARTLGPARHPPVAKAAAVPSCRFKAPAAPSRGARGPTADDRGAPAPESVGRPGATAAAGTAAVRAVETGVSRGASPTRGVGVAQGAIRRAAPVSGGAGTGTVGTVSGTSGATPAA